MVVPNFFLNKYRARRWLELLLRLVVRVARVGTALATALDVWLQGMIIRRMLEIRDVQVVLQLLVIVVGQLVVLADLR